MNADDRLRLLTENQALREQLVRHGEEFEQVEADVTQLQTEAAAWRSRYQFVVTSRSFRVALLLRRMMRLATHPLDRRRVDFTAEAESAAEIPSASGPA